MTFDLKSIIIGAAIGLSWVAFDWLRKKGKKARLLAERARLDNLLWIFALEAGEDAASGEAQYSADTVKVRNQILDLYNGATGLKISDSLK